MVAGSVSAYSFSRRDLFACGVIVAIGAGMAAQVEWKTTGDLESAQHRFEQDKGHEAKQDAKRLSNGFNQI